MIDADLLRAAPADTRAQMDAAARRAGRDPRGRPACVRPVSTSLQKMPPCWCGPAPVIGENRAQDLVAKHGSFGDAFDYHFIGHLQSRKTRRCCRSSASSTRWGA